jgi:3-methyladenine DNA glycosylase/8-oxoguanine DNA glycosylase
LKLTEIFSVELPAFPPYSFELTIHKPAGWYWATPNEVYESGILWSAIRFCGDMLGLRLCSKGTVDVPLIKCEVYSQNKLDSPSRKALTATLKRALKTDEDLSGFYSLSRKDSILQTLIDDLYGMHTVGWPELFPALILATTLQMAPLKRSNQMMNLLMTHFGEDTNFDGKKVRYWPSAQKIVSATVEELMAEAKLGYRAKNLKAIAAELREDFPTMDELSTLSNQEAKQKLLSLYGIGEYSAELVMPQMGFPLDVWSAKIFSVLLTGKVPENPRDVIPSVKAAAQKRWGNWSGYAFVYALNDLPRLSSKVGIDLTKF